MIYFLVFLVNGIMTLISQFFNNKKLTRLFAVLILAFLILFGGLRYDIGYDYYNYSYLYDSLILYNEATNLEFGFQLLIKICDFFGGNYEIFVFILTLIIVTSKGNFILKYSYLPILSILIYYSRVYLNSDFGQIRQGFAMIFVLFSIVPLHQRNIKKFSLLIFLGVLFHVSSIFFFPVYFFAKRNYSIKTLLVILSTSFVFLIVNFKEVLTGFINYLPVFAATKVLVYSTSEADEEIGITFSLIFRIFIILISLFVVYKKLQKNNNEMTVFNIYYFGVIFYIIFNTFPQLSGRGSLYFLQFEILLFPIIYKNISNFFLKSVFLLLIIAYCYWGLASIIESQPESFIPYKNLLFYDFVR